MNALQRLGGFFTRLGGGTVEERGGWEVLEEVFLKNRESSGVYVTPATALTYSAVFACIRILAETVGSLPLILYERLPKGKRRAQEHYLYQLLHDRPNELMTSLEYRETVQGHLAGWGNAYSLIDYDGAGRLANLWPLRPDRVLDKHIVEGRRLYLYQFPNGDTRWFGGENIWHLRGLGGDGYDGYSVIGLHRKAIGLGLAAAEFGERFFGNDARPGIVLEHPLKLSPEAHKRLESSWEDAHKGLSKSHKVAVLEEGMKLHEIGIPPEDAQFLETRKFQVNEIARIFRIPPHMLADLDRATFSNIEHLGIEFVVHTMRPWLVRWEQSILRNLMLESERKRFYPEFLVDGLLRGDTSSRFTAYATARQNGWLSANEIRELENMNPVPGGDVYLIPLNMVPVSGSQQPSQAEPSSIRRDLLQDSAEQRTMRSATMRRRLRGSYFQIYQDTAARILRREAADVGKQARKQLRTRDFASFLAWLDRFYQEHVDWVIRQMTPVNNSYGESVAAEAQDEVNAQAGLTPELEKFIQSYTGGYGARHVGISLDRIRAAIQKAQADSSLDPVETLEEEMDTWEETRSNIIADEESTRFNNALAKTVYTIAGFISLRWVAFGKSCPYCSSLDGRTVGIEENFLSSGDQIQPEGADTPMTTSSNIGHPPAHGGCDCMIVAGV